MEKLLLKDQLFNKSKIEYLSKLIKEVHDDFDDKLFEKLVYKKFNELELKQRIFHIRDLLYDFLPSDYKKSIDIIIKSLPKELNPDNTDNDFGDFIFAPFWEYIAKYWCNKEYLKLSYKVLEEITKRFTVEWPIRSFFNNFEDETLKQIIIWSKSNNYHIRRLASEWSRPKLPWAEKIKLDYKKAEQILDNLYFDNTRFVTRSVANHLNDISKIDPDFVVYLLNKWKKENKQSKKEFDFIVKHSLRTLIKQWNKNALEFIWISSWDIKDVVLDIKNPNINLWEKLLFYTSFKSLSDQEILVDYIVYFLNTRWKYNKKVFKLTKIKTHKDELVIIKKNHLFDNFSTRKLNKWIHAIDIQINGENVISSEFEIL